jgi:hypothetical protein
MKEQSSDTVRQLVRDHYGKVAVGVVAAAVPKQSTDAVCLMPRSSIPSVKLWDTAMKTFHQWWKVST